MCRKLIVFAFLFIAGCLPLETRVNFRQFQASVVYIEARDRFGERLCSGSGIIIGNNYVLTAAHVLQDANSVSIEILHGNVTSSSTFSCLDNVDIGFITVDGLNAFAVKLAKEFPDVGDEIYIVGCPYGRDRAWTVTRGIISYTYRQVSELWGDTLLMQTDCSSWPGNSGGGAFNNRGELIGVVVGGLRGEENIALLIPISEFRTRILQEQK